MLLTAAAIFFAQEQQPPAPPQAPDVHVNVDLGGIVDGIVNGLTSTLQSWANQLPDQAATNGLDVVHQATQSFGMQGLNFISRTPLELVRVGNGLLAAGDVRQIITDASSLVMVLAGISFAGSYFFAWPRLNETLSRLVVAILLAGITPALLDFSAQAFDALASAIVFKAPEAPDFGMFANPLIAVLMGLLWLGLTIRLELQLGKRLIWLALLYPIGTLASATFMHSKSAWLGSMYWKLWVAWGLGQFLALIAISVSLAMLTTVGGTGGVLLSLSSLLVAYDVLKVLVPLNSGLSVSASMGPVGLQI